MEALTACSVALLTIYDMCKAVDRKMTMGRVRLIEKHLTYTGALQSGPLFHDFCLTGSVSQNIMAHDSLVHMS